MKASAAGMVQSGRDGRGRISADDCKLGMQSSASLFSPPFCRMKVYNLSCEHEHRFEGWFSSEEDFIAQSDAHNIECPMCGSRAVRKLLSAPRLSLSGAQAAKADPGLQIQAQILEMVRQVVANTEDVGERFAEEARRIHYNETPERAIRGVATVQEFEELADEGIEVMPLPIPGALKTPLQ